MREKIDWNDFLNKENYSLEELINAKEHSISWVTCAVGNQCTSLPRLDNGCPVDKKLANLGDAFNIHIHNMWWETISNSDNIYSFQYNKHMAKGILHKIEERSKELLNKGSEYEV